MYPEKARMLHRPLHVMGQILPARGLTVIPWISKHDKSQEIP
jgi:hypothetical protein